MTRTSIIAMLAAVEVLIVGIGLYALHGRNGFSMHPGRTWTAVAIEPIAAGNAPLIEVDDPDSHVDVATSRDGLVHVVDRSSGSFATGTFARLHVSRTASGVSIVRPDAGMEHLQFGFDDRHIEVDVPAGAHLTIARCSGATVSGLQGGAEVHSQDGRITMSQIKGQALVARSDDGRIRLDDVWANSLDARSRDGEIDVSGITMTGDAPHAVLHSDDGAVRVALQRDADLVVDASTDDGDIYVDGSSAKAAGDDDSAHHTIRLGNGSGSLRASSSDGSIHITTNGAV